MVTNYPQQLTSRETLGAAVRPRQVEQSMASSLFARVHQMFCGLRGHDNLLQFEQDRMFLKCASCGHESPGWELTEAPPTTRLRGDARRHVLAHPQLVDARRIA